MDFSLTEEQLSVRQQIISFAKRELNADVIRRDREGAFLRELWLKCAEQKLTGLQVEETFGGAGLDAFTTIQALEALGYGCEDGGLTFSIGAHLLAVVVPIWKFGTEEQKQHLLPALCNGTAIGINAMTESDSGSDVFDMRTMAEKKGGQYVINGVKTFCSNGSIGDRIIVYAATDKAKGYYGGISAFVVDRATAGISVGQEFEKMGLRTSGTAELVFENVTVPRANRIGQEGAGATIFNHSMEWERIGIAASHVGAMTRLLERTVEYAGTRSIGNEPIGKKQAVAHTIADMKVQLEAASLLVNKAASALEKSRDNMLNASAAKLFVSEAFIGMATAAMQVHGGNGYMTEYGIERMLRDAMGSTIYSGTSEIQRNIISRMMGL